MRMSRSKLLAILGTSAFLLGSFTMGGCPQSGGGGTGEGAEVADESTNSTATPDESADVQDGSQLDEPVIPNPPDITDAGNNDSGVVGDFDGDQALTEADINILAKSFDSNLAGGDLNSDNQVDILDLALLLSLVR